MTVKLQILVNKTPVTHVNPDIILLGDADGIIQYLCGRLGWELPATQDTNGDQTPPLVDNEPKRVGNSYVWMFNGAKTTSWTEKVAKESDPSSAVPSELQETLNQAPYLPGCTRGRRNSEIEERTSKRSRKK